MKSKNQQIKLLNSRCLTKNLIKIPLPKLGTTVGGEQAGDGIAGADTTIIIIIGTILIAMPVILTTTILITTDTIIPILITTVITVGTTSTIRNSI